jgi:hypothetical protein
VKRSGSPTASKKKVRQLCKIRGKYSPRYKSVNLLLFKVVGLQSSVPAAGMFWFIVQQLTK